MLAPNQFSAGELTKIRAGSVSGKACRSVAERVGVPQMLLDMAPEESMQVAEQLITTERVLASVVEAVIGACYLEYGYDRVAPAVVHAFEIEMAAAIKQPEDFKSTLQELLAMQSKRVRYRVISESGPPHMRTFEVAAVVDGEQIGIGVGSSKKSAEQLAAQETLKSLEELS